MDFKERTPIETQLDREPKVETAHPLAFENITKDLEGAIQAVGADEVANALIQVETGRARPEELLAWIDELRDPEIDKAEPPEPPLGFMHDFEYDTEIASGETDKKGDDEVDADAPQQDGHEAGGGGDDDGHYLFSAVRRKAQADDDGEGGGDGGGGGGGDGDGKPKQPPPDADAVAAAAKAKAPSKPAKPDKPAKADRSAKPAKDPHK